jgi:hypothetical protein
MLARAWHHRGMTDDLDAALDRLYGLPAEDFTAARDALAKELRGAKRRDDADAVKQRRRPTAPAAAINQVARLEPERVEELIGAADELRGVQERLLAGDAGRDELRAAADAERRAVAALVSAASRLPDKPSAPALEKVRATLQAAATDDAVRDAIARGRLEREAEPAGAWGAFPLSGTVEPAPDAKTAGRTKRRAAAAKPATAETAEEAEEEAHEAPSTVERAGERRARKRAEALERARAEDAEARRELEDAEQAAAEAHEVLEAAAARAQEARAAVVDAEAAEDEARSAAQRTLRALKRAEAVAADTGEKIARLEGA